MKNNLIIEEQRVLQWVLAEIERVRIDKDMTQLQASQKAGIHEKSWSRIINHGSNKRDALEGIANAVGLNLDELIARARFHVLTAPQNTINPETFNTQLLSLCSTLPDQFKEQIMTHAQGLRLLAASHKKGDKDSKKKEPPKPVEAEDQSDKTLPTMSDEFFDEIEENNAGENGNQKLGNDH